MATKKTVAKKTTTRKTTTKKTVTKKNLNAQPRKRAAAKPRVQKSKQVVEVQAQEKPKKRLKKKYIVFLCLYALSFVLYYSSTSLARYATEINQAGNVGVAKWDVSLSGASSETLETITIGDDDTYQEYNLTVTSNSEVALTYSAVLTNVPNDLYIIVDDDETNPHHSQSGTITLNNLGSFEAADQDNTHVHKLKFIVPIGSDTITNQKIDIDVVFSQVPL